MSGLRYQTDSGDVVSGDAAQNFLKNKLSKGIAGKYTQEQVDRLAESGGPAVVNASDGAVPGGRHQVGVRHGVRAPGALHYDPAAVLPGGV